MTWQTALAITILATGAVGHLLALTMIARLRWWLGQRGAGWPRILLRTLIVGEVGYAALYLISLSNTLNLLNRVTRGVLNLVAAIALALLPWALAWALHAWRRQAEQERDLRDTTTLLQAQLAAERATRETEGGEA